MVDDSFWAKDPCVLTRIADELVLGKKWLCPAEDLQPMGNYKPQSVDPLRTALPAKPHLRAARPSLL